MSPQPKPGFWQEFGTGMAQGAANQSPLFKALYNRYMSGRTPLNNFGSPPPPVGMPGSGDDEQPVGPDVGDSVGTGVPQLAGGSLVTKPTIAKIGEKGPEAVIPLNPRAGNKMQPDVLEGHVSAPRVPGLHFSRYRTFNRFGPGQGGQIA